MSDVPARLRDFNSTNWPMKFTATAVVNGVKYEMVWEFGSKLYQITLELDGKRIACYREVGDPVFPEPQHAAIMAAIWEVVDTCTAIAMLGVRADFPLAARQHLVNAGQPLHDVRHVRDHLGALARA